MNRSLPKLAGNGKLLDLGRRGEVQTVASVAEAKRFCNSVKKTGGLVIDRVSSFFIYTYTNIYIRGFVRGDLREKKECKAFLVDKRE